MLVVWSQLNDLSESVVVVVVVAVVVVVVVVVVVLNRQENNMFSKFLRSNIKF